MKSGFEGPLAKIDRAKEHLKTARSVEVDFFSDLKGEIRLSPIAGSTSQNALIVSDQTPPIMMSILVSEVIYHVRSALDQSVIAALRQSGITSKKKLKNRYFPSGDDANGFKNDCDKYLEGMHSKSSDVIRKSNNFTGGSDYLRAVFMASNTDKHWELIATGNYAAPTGSTGYTFSGVSVEFGPAGNVNEGIPIGVVHAGGSIAPNMPSAHIPLTGHFTIEEMYHYAGSPIIQTLESALSQSEGIIKELVEGTIVIYRRFWQGP
jgi:hypothetical protein